MPRCVTDDLPAENYRWTLKLAGWYRIGTAAGHDSVMRGFYSPKAEGRDRAEARRRIGF
jgi:hypothetical protein